MIIAYGGIVANFIVALLGIILISIYSINNYYINLFISQSISLHLAEAITYLVIGNIYLVSDMEVIAKINAKLRPINFALGVVISIFYFQYLLQLQQSILGVVIVFNLLVIISMGIGRIVFTYIYSKK